MASNQGTHHEIPGIWSSATGLNTLSIYLSIYLSIQILERKNKPFKTPHIQKFANLVLEGDTMVSSRVQWEIIPWTEPNRGCISWQQVEWPFLTRKGLWCCHDMSRNKSKKAQCHWNFNIGLKTQKLYKVPLQIPGETWKLTPKHTTFTRSKCLEGQQKAPPPKKKHWTPCCKFAQKKGKGIGSCNLAANIFQALPGSNPWKQFWRCPPS